METPVPEGFFCGQGIGAEIMPRSCHGGQKLVLGIFFPEFNPSDGPLLEAKYSHRGHDSAKLGEKLIVPRFRADQFLGEQMLTGWEAYEPQASTDRY